MCLVGILKYSKMARCWENNLHTLLLTSQVWPEVTDPEKFVYEDVAIAAYLLVRTAVVI